MPTQKVSGAISTGTSRRSVLWLSEGLLLGGGLRFGNAWTLLIRALGSRGCGPPGKGREHPLP